jgi:hypothetical protein
MPNELNDPHQRLQPVGTLMKVIGPDYNGSRAWVGRLGRVVNASAYNDRCELALRDDSGFNHRTWFFLGSLWLWIPPPTIGNPEALERWLTS